MRLQRQKSLVGCLQAEDAGRLVKLRLRPEDPRTRKLMVWVPESEIPRAKVSSVQGQEKTDAPAAAGRESTLPVLAVLAWPSLQWMLCGPHC